MEPKLIYFSVGNGSSIQFRHKNLKFNQEPIQPTLPTIN